MIFTTPYDSLERIAVALAIPAPKIDRNLPVAEAVERFFQGTAYDAVPLRRGEVGTGLNLAGGIFNCGEGKWISLVHRDGDAYLVGEATVSEKAKEEDLKDVVSGWIIRRKANFRQDLSDFLARHKKSFAQILFAGLLVNLSGLVLPIFSSFVYDKVLGNKLFETLWAFVIGLLLVACLDICLRQIRTIVAERSSLANEAEIDRDVMQKLMKAPGAEVPSVGKFLDRYKRVLAGRDFLSSTYLLSLVDVPFVLLYLGVVAYAAGWLVLIPLLCGVAMVAINALTMRVSLRYDIEGRKAEEDKFRLLVDTLTAHEAVSCSALRSEVSGQWREASGQASLYQSLSRMWKATGYSLSASLSFLSYVFVIVGGVYGVESNSLTSGGLLAASMLSSRAISNFSSFSTLLLRYKEFRASLRDLNALFPAQPDIPKIDCSVRGVMELRGVTCALGNASHPVLGDLSLRVDAGEIVGIAGTPGSGKTTLLRLLAGIYRPDKGHILIDNYPVAQFSEDMIANCFGYKPQELGLIDGTIEQNIVAGGDPLTAEEREEILSVTGLGFIFKNTGIHWATPVGPRGSFLSGGQRQLVALARAILRDRPVLLLDEPTNGLDVQLEAHLAKELLARKGRSTIIISTHSRHLLSICDRIIVVGQGRVLADGPREKILVA